MTSGFRGTLTAAAAVALGAAVLAQPAAGQQMWRFALEEIEGSVQHAYALEFARRIEEKTGGQVGIQIFPYTQIGTSAEIAEQTADGVLQLTNASPGHLGTLVPEVQVFSIPYLLSEIGEVNKRLLAESETIYGPLAEALERRGLRLMTMYPEGEMVWTGNREVRTPEDFDGFRMRVMVSPMLVESYRAFGATPTPMPYGEVYSGLQLGMIDGQVNPIFAIEEMNFYEVQDYMIFAGQEQFVTTVVANPDWYHGLSPELQEIVDETFLEMADYIFDLQEQYNQERLEIIKERRPQIQIIELTDDEREAFRQRAEVAEDVFVGLAGETGREILEALKAEIAGLEAEHN